MKHIYFTVQLILSSVLFLNAQSNAIDDVIKDLERRETEAIVKSDTASLKKLWAADFSVHSSSNAIGLLSEGDKIALRYASFDRYIERIFVYDNVVITMGYEIVKPLNDNNSAARPINRRFTNVWMKRGGVWQLTSRHSSNICPDTN